METLILEPTDKNIKLCANALKKGELVAFATETVYGLGANAFDAEAVAKIYIAKGRPSDNPLIVHVHSVKQIEQLVQSVPNCARALISEFMPGPLTIVFKKNNKISDIVTGKLGTIGIRMPSHPICRKLLIECGLPVCAPSANTSSKPSPTIARHVYDDLKGKIPYILDGGSCDIGVESTIIDVSEPTPRLLRLGGLPIESLEKVVGKLEIVKSSSVPLCPGMKYKHYAPKADVFFSAYYDEMFYTILHKYDELVTMGKTPVIMCLNASSDKYGTREKLCVGNSYQEYAHNLFLLLRKADELKYDTVIAEGVIADGIGAAIINRLVKASGGQII